MREPSLVEALNAIREKARDDAFLDLAGAMLLISTSQSGFVDRDIQGIIRVLGEPEVLSQEGAWKIVDIVDEYWPQLKISQRELVAGALMRLFGHSPWGMFQMRIAEAIASRYDPVKATAWITRNVPLWEGEARGALVHAAEHLMPRVGPADAAYVTLVRMLKRARWDTDGRVRQEAGQALRKAGIDEE